MKMILASASPRRKKLLRQLGFSFKVQPSTVNEQFNAEWPADKIAVELALRKSKDVAAQFKEALVIGADTIVVFNDQILNKPEDKQQARNMLLKLSGKKHDVYTGVALCKVDSNQNITDITTFYEKTEVTFGELHPADLEAYVESGNPMDKAGAYGIQDDFGAIFVKRIEGDFYSVVGFPLHAFYAKMHSFAPEFLSIKK